jgi:Zn-dependent protease with chaperone function
MILEWRGYYFDGRTAARRPAAVQISRGGLTFKLEDGSTHFWPYETIRQSQGFYSGEQVRFEKAGESAEALLVTDTDFLNTLHRMVPGVHRRFHRPERRPMRRSLTGLAALGVLASISVLYLWGIPAAAKVVAARVPVSWEETLGHNVVEQFAPGELRCTDSEMTRLVADMTSRLAAAAPSPYQFRVTVVRVPIVNAFAAPGGYVVVFQGLIEATRRPEELAAVLAHEFEHIVQKHTTRMLLQTTTTGLMISALTGDLSGAVTFGASAAHTLGTLRYSRAMEEEADVEGIKILSAAGYDPMAMIDFFETLKKTTGNMPQAAAYFSSHPSTDERIATLKSLAWREKPKVSPFAKVNWAELKKRCRAAARKN